MKCNLPLIFPNCLRAAAMLPVFTRSVIIKVHPCIRLLIVIIGIYLATMEPELKTEPEIMFNEYDPETGDWNTYIRELLSCFDKEPAMTDDQKIENFLTVCGERTLDNLLYLLKPKECWQVSFEEIVRMLTVFYNRYGATPAPLALGSRNIGIKKPECLRCGKKHGGLCRYILSICFFCKHRGHIESCCQLRKILTKILRVHINQNDRLHDRSASDKFVGGDGTPIQEDPRLQYYRQATDRAGNSHSSYGPFGFFQNPPLPGYSGAQQWNPYTQSYQDPTPYMAENAQYWPGNQQPNTGYPQQYWTGNTQQWTGNSHQWVGKSQPSSGVPQTWARNSQPRSEIFQPRVEFSHAITDNTQSKAKPTQSMAETTQPRADKTQPRADNVQALTGHQQRVESSQPRVDNESAPRNENAQVTDKTSQSKAKSTRPKAENAHAWTGSAQPRAESLQPRIDHPQATQFSVDNTQPRGGYTQCRVTTQPMNISTQQPISLFIYFDQNLTTPIVLSSHGWY